MYFFLTLFENMHNEATVRDLSSFLCVGDYCIMGHEYSAEPLQGITLFSESYMRPIASGNTCS